MMYSARNSIALSIIKELAPRKVYAGAREVFNRHASTGIGRAARIAFAYFKHFCK